MNNKTLAMLAAIPLTLSFLSGFTEGLTGAVFSDGWYICLGLFMALFVPWSLIRLYKTNDQ